MSQCPALIFSPDHLQPHWEVIIFIITNEPMMSSIAFKWLSYGHYEYLQEDMQHLINAKSYGNASGPYRPESDIQRPENPNLDLQRTQEDGEHTFIWSKCHSAVSWLSLPSLKGRLV